MEILFGIAWLACAILTPSIAGATGRGGLLWVLLGFLLGPLALLAVVATIPAKPIKAEAQRVPCPYCAEMILPGAKLCRYCGGALPQP